MMRVTSLLTLTIVLFLSLSCGEEKKQENLKLETFQEKLSYTLGASSGKDFITNPNFPHVDKISKAELLQGFKKGYREDANPEGECKEKMEKLFGATGQDFNEEYAKEGSECIGQYLAVMLYGQLNSFDKAKTIDTTLLFRGFEDGLNGKDTTVLSEEEQTTVLTEFSKGIQAIIEEKMEAQYGENKKKGEEFLKENAKRKEVIITKSGLQYEVLKKGNGKSPDLNDVVKVHYHGTLIDGTVFDSSIDRGEPATFGVNQVIPGWTEVLQLMKEGDKFRVYIPQELAYGANPQPGGPIEPYSALIFDVELLEVQPK